MLDVCLAAVFDENEVLNELLGIFNMNVKIPAVTVRLRFPDTMAVNSEFKKALL